MACTLAGQHLCQFCATAIMMDAHLATASGARCTIAAFETDSPILVPGSETATS